MNYMKLKKKTKIVFLLFIVFVILFIQNLTTNIIWPIISSNSKQKRIGVVSLFNLQNVGNILVKFAMFKKLEELGFNVSMIIPKYYRKIDTSFINRTINKHIIMIKESFSELNEKDYDYLIVNSDQTWSFYNKKFFYDIALLKFAQNWKTKKFIYGASMGVYNWFYKKSDEELFKGLLSNFTGISFREKGTVKILEEHLGLKSVFVLDPTLLINKRYYLNAIKGYKSEFNSDDKFIFIYQLDKNPTLEKVIKDSSEKFNLKIYKLKLHNNDYMESFIYGISNCQCVITDSFHGTMFSIIFKKPFISFSNSNRGKARFDSAKEAFNIRNRIIERSGYNDININLLIEPLNINETALNELKAFSIHYLKHNLDLV